ncbi:nitrate reductase [Thiorhodovibrio winogradskyi]|nr:nitrate reductase [Thiorhodovibrio winogradskyi]
MAQPGANPSAPASASGPVVGLETGPAAGQISAGQISATPAAQQGAALKTPDPQAAEENRACLRCHGMATLGYRDAETGEIVNLAVDRELFGHSVHGDLACSKCHGGDYQGYPHPPELSAAELNCVACHEDHPENTDRLDFSLINEEYQASVHAMSDDPEAQGFNCHSCHDPHAFRASLLGREIPDIVAYDNQICMSCHDDLRDPLSLSHSWLPNPSKHWESVRCLDCHTPLSESGRPVSHQILSAEQSNVNCVNCHTQGQGLLARLYEYRSQQDIESRGFFAKAVFNDAYVVGMSRNSLIDLLALIIIGLTVLVLAGHGYGRYRAYRALREQQAAASEGDKQ